MKKIIVAFMILNLLFLVSCQTKEVVKQPAPLAGEGEFCDAVKTCAGGFSCWSLPNDNISSPVCVSDSKYPSSDDLCEKYCGKKGCMVLESYPAQLVCPK